MEIDFDATYLTVDIVRSIMAEFTWPTSFELEDDLPDGIVVNFPNSHIYLSDDYLGEVYLNFLTEDTGTASNLSLGHAMDIVVPVAERGEGPLPELINDIRVEGSVDKVQNELRDLFNILLTHLQSVILGDFSWAKAYQEA